MKRQESWRRYVLYGVRDSAWGDIIFDTDNELEYKFVALEWLEQGYHVSMTDQKTGEWTELTLRYDGLGVS